MTLPPIRRVAVIGAGISGVCSAAHLLRQGLEVTVFERSSISGGVWHLDEEVAIEPEYPNETPSRGDYERTVEAPADLEYGYLTPPASPDEQDNGVREGTPDNHDPCDGSDETESAEQQKHRARHAPPGPCYVGLKNNVPLTLMKTSLGEWPTGSEEYVSQSFIEKHIQDIAEAHGVKAVTLYNTRVEDVRKVEQGWRIRTVQLAILPGSRRNQLIQKVWHFDAVVIASGHYHMPRTPNIPGLREWKVRFPERISHSKGYRQATSFKNQNVLLIGAGTSSADIAKELGQVARHVYQSSRGGQLDYPASCLPENGTRIGGIKSFDILDDQCDASSERLEGHIPGIITLHNGDQLSNIDRVVVCTGYVTSYPFMPQYHDDNLPGTNAADHILVTREGDMVHNLHEDIFYIEDPTLAFVGVPYHVATFSLYDFQAQAVSRAFSGHVNFPSYSDMRHTYVQRVKENGVGRNFHSLRESGAEPAYVTRLVEWVDERAEQDGVHAMTGHSREWLEAYLEFRKIVETRVGIKMTKVKHAT